MASLRENRNSRRQKLYRKWLCGKFSSGTSLSYPVFDLSATITLTSTRSGSTPPSKHTHTNLTPDHQVYIKSTKTWFYKIQSFIPLHCYKLKFSIQTRIYFQLAITISSSQLVSQKTWGVWRQLNHRLASPKKSVYHQGLGNGIYYTIRAREFYL